MPPLFVAVLPKKMSEDAFYALGEGAGGAPVAGLELGDCAGGAQSVTSRPKSVRAVAFGVGGYTLKAAESGRAR